MTSRVRPETLRVMGQYQPGRRLFLAGSIVLILFGAVHVLAVYKSLIVGPESPAEADADRALRAFSMNMGPFHPTGWHTLNILNASYSVLLIYAGVINLIALGPAIAAGRLRALTLANMIFVALIAAVPLLLQFPPPLVFALLALILFILSLVKQRSRAIGGQ